MKKREIKSNEVNFSIIKPFDAHIHLRVGKLLKSVISYSIKDFGSAVVMGNLSNPVDDVDKALRYQEEIMSHVPDNNNFSPIMTMMVTKNLTPEKVLAAEGVVKVLKFIPAGTSTNSETGVTWSEFMEKYIPVLQAAAKANMIFSIHAELINDVYGNLIPELEREKASLPLVKKIIDSFDNLKIIIEHVSTAAACQLVNESSNRVAATVTLHHLLLDSSQVYDAQGNIKNIYYYCKPVAKLKSDRQAIQAEVFSGNKKFFFGSDSAPHLIVSKRLVKSAGIFTAPIAIEKLCEIFFLNRRQKFFENFVSIYGRNFYELPIPKEKIVLVRLNNEYPKESKGIKMFNINANQLKWIIMPE